MTNATTTTSRSARFFFALAAGLALLGLALLGGMPGAPAPAAPQGTTHLTPPAPPSPAVGGPSRKAGPQAAAASGMPVPGDGAAGDKAVQQLLDRFSPADLPPAEARAVVRLATRIWMADVTGRGRNQWPRYFASGAPNASALHGAYANVRIQAGIARKAAHGRIAVRLVWAGTDPSGTRRDGRLAVLLFRHAPHDSNRWEPVR
ncbi:hypothetical protein [Streptomyces lydicus]|uniref:hypothetical protein n=1 Tax=Streptomyces lydicus TaxID=47763 RepID=UPI0036E223F7